MPITIQITLLEDDVRQLCDRYSEFAPEPLTVADIAAHTEEVQELLNDFVYGKIITLLDKHDDAVFNLLADIFDPEDEEDECIF